MPERKVEPKQKHREKLDKAKAIVKKHWKPFTMGVVSTGVTIGVIIVTKRVIFPNHLAVLAKKIVIKDSVLFFQTYARQQGPPSWVVRCVETGRVFASQAEAARLLSVHPNALSRHLTGTQEHVKGYHFERVAIAGPRTA
jgi:hypothetical protein